LTASFQNVLGVSVEYRSIIEKVLHMILRCRTWQRSEL